MSAITDRILDEIVQEINDRRNAGPSLSHFRDGLRVAHVIVRRVVEQESIIAATLVDAIKKPGMLVFLDGDDPIEGGAHVIPDFPVTASGLSELMDDPDHANDVMEEAKKLGFKDGDFVWTEWCFHKGYPGDPAAPSYWEFVGINVKVTKILAPSSGEDRPESG